MLPLSHLGIGSAISQPLSRDLPLRWLLLGTMLPDLIDKPAFFLMGLYAHFDHGGWVPGKRGIAHTFVFLAALWITAKLRKSAALKAVAVGMATHLFLDAVSKATSLNGFTSASAVLLWPFLGFSFPTLSYGVHGWSAVALEAVGALLLAIRFVLNRRTKIHARSTQVNV